MSGEKWPDGLVNFSASKQSLYERLCSYLQNNIFEFNYISMGIQPPHGLDFSQVIYLIDTERKADKDPFNCNAD